MRRSLMRRLPLLAGKLPSAEAVFAPGQWRHVFAWFASRRPDYLLDRALPWLTYDAIRFLRGWMRPGLRVFEYGSGASTLFWATYQAQVVAVEHDPAWVETLRRRLPADAQVDLRLVAPDAKRVNEGPTVPGDASDPLRYETDWHDWAAYTFHDYAAQIDAFPDEYFDVVLVDGQARPSCIYHAHAKVRVGGLLIVDNADVPLILARTLPLLRDFERRRFIGLAPINGALSETDVFIRKNPG